MINYDHTQIRIGSNKINFIFYQTKNQINRFLKIYLIRTDMINVTVTVPESYLKSKFVSFFDRNGIKVKH